MPVVVPVVAIRGPAKPREQVVGEDGGAQLIGFLGILARSAGGENGQALRRRGYVDANVKGLGRACPLDPGKHA